MLAKLLDAAKNYTLWDWALLKLALVTLGILLGIYLYPVMFEYRAVVWVVFVVCYLATAYRTLKHFKNL